MTALVILLACQDVDLQWRMKKGDRWIEHRRNEYVTTEGESRSRQAIETKTEFLVESEGKDEVTLSRTVLRFAFQAESAEGTVDVLFEDGTWKKSDWGGNPTRKEDYEDSVLHPPKLIAKPNGETRALEEEDGKVVDTFPHSPALLPGRPVKIGESWAVARNEEGPTEFLIAMKLVSVEGRTAVLQMTMTLPGRVESLTDELSARGSMPVAVRFEDGLIRSEEGEGEFVLTRRNPAGGKPVETRLARRVRTTRERTK